MVLTMFDCTISDVEQGSLPWHELRWGNVTGTRLKSALGSKAVRRSLLLELVAERMCENEVDPYCSPAMQWGKDHEAEAIGLARLVRDANYHTIGMMISNQIEGFRFSPDGVHFSDNGEIIGGIEVKCPMSKTHIGYLIDGIVPKDYMMQVTAPFLMCDSVQWWDFVSYDPRNHERNIFIVRTTREEIGEVEIEKYRAELINYLSEVAEAEKSIF